MIDATPDTTGEDDDDAGIAALVITVSDESEISVTFGYDDDEARLLLIAAIGDVLTHIAGCEHDEETAH